MKPALKALLIWFCILALAIANGLLRESLLLPAFGAPTALILSGLLLAVLIIGVACLSVPWLRLQQPAHYWFVGIGWLTLTLIFEFSFGRIQGKSWSELFEAYTFQNGNILPAVLVVVACAPAIASKLRRRLLQE